MSSVSASARVSTAQELDSFINENYDCIGNVANISQAKVILLGEDHSSDRHLQINAKVINTLNAGSDEDIVLLETTPALKFFSTQDRYVRRAITTEGWDNRSLWPTVVSLGGVLAVAGVLQQAIYHGLSILNPSSSFFSYERLRSVVKLGLCVGATYMAFKIGRVLSNWGFVGSNRNMAHLVSQHLHSKRKIYIMAGTAHLQNSSSDNQVHKQAVQELHSYLSDKTYMILIPKPPSPKVQRSWRSVLRNFLP